MIQSATKNKVSYHQPRTTSGNTHLKEQSYRQHQILFNGNPMINSGSYIDNSTTDYIPARSTKMPIGKSAMMYQSYRQTQLVQDDLSIPEPSISNKQLGGNVYFSKHIPAKYEGVNSQSQRNYEIGSMDFITTEYQPQTLASQLAMDKFISEPQATKIGPMYQSSRQNQLLNFSNQRIYGEYQ